MRESIAVAAIAMALALLIPGARADDPAQQIIGQEAIIQIAQPLTPSQVRVPLPIWQ